MTVSVLTLGAMVPGPRSAQADSGVTIGGDEQARAGVSFTSHDSLEQLSPQTKNTWWAVVVDNATSKSSVIRTVDSGAHWQNVTPPVSQLRVGSISGDFLNAEIGWVLIGPLSQPSSQRPPKRSFARSTAAGPGRLSVRFHTVASSTSSTGTTGGATSSVRRWVPRPCGYTAPWTAATPGTWCRRRRRLRRPRRRAPSLSGATRTSRSPRPRLAGLRPPVPRGCRTCTPATSGAAAGSSCLMFQFRRSCRLLEDGTWPSLSWRGTRSPSR